MQQRLRGDTAAEETGAAQLRVLIDQGGAQSQIRRLESRGISARASADNCYVVALIHRVIPFTGASQTKKHRLEIFQDLGDLIGEARAVRPVDEPVIIGNAEWQH